MPKNIVGRRKRCIGVMHQDSPFISPNNSDDEEDGFADISGRGKAERDIAEALLGMGQGLKKDNYAIEEGEGEGGKADVRDKVVL